MDWVLCQTYYQKTKFRYFYLAWRQLCQINPILEVLHRPDGRHVRTVTAYCSFTRHITMVGAQIVKKDGIFIPTTYSTVRITLKSRKLSVSSTLKISSG